MDDAGVEKQKVLFLGSFTGPEMKKEIGVSFNICKYSPSIASIMGSYRVKYHFVHYTLFKSLYKL